MFLMTSVAGDVGGGHDVVVVDVVDVGGAGGGGVMMTYLRRNGDCGGVFCDHLILSRVAACCCPVFSFFVQHNSRFSFLVFFLFLFFDLSFSAKKKKEDRMTEDCIGLKQ